MNTLASLWRRIEPEPNSGCWFWTGRQHNGRYGRVGYGGEKYLAHRLLYELERGKIPEGLTLDHGCRQSLCVNPDHMTPMTLRENQLLGGQYIKTRCPRGHIYDGIAKRGDGRTFRYCKTCDNVRTLKRYHDRRRASGITFTNPEER